MERNPNFKCIDTAAAAGIEPEDAGKCENGSLNCPSCPFPGKRPQFSKLAVLLSRVLDPFNIAVRECAWCADRKIIGFSCGQTGITSGMCSRCEKEFIKELKANKP